MNTSMERNANWKGGRRVGTDGYVYVKQPGHPRATTNGYVREHILVVEAAIGKPLRRSAEVHHVDEQRAHNAPTNLVACDSAAYHRLLHRRLRAVRACGNPNALPCTICGGYAEQWDMYVRKGGGSGFHRRCSSSAQRRRYHAIRA